MVNHEVAIYYAWDRASEVEAPLGVIENRFPSLFETRRILFPHYEELADPETFDQGIAGFLDQILKKNFADFVALAAEVTGRQVAQIERGDAVSGPHKLDDLDLEKVDTLIIISFDSMRSRQHADAAEVAAARSFLDKPGNLMFVCPHHDIGDVDDAASVDWTGIQTAEFLHHGDRTIPPQQRFGGFARSLLAGLGTPIENRFGLHPAMLPDGTPAPIAAEHQIDRLGLLSGVETFNLHPHLPHLERLGEAIDKMNVLARQPIDPKAPSHSFTREGRFAFDALLQSKRGVFRGDLLVGDATLWSSTAGGLESLRRLWTNVVSRGAN
ncbi:hypothetical protein QTL95_18055 [Rhizobium sp. S152]|uniref:hypothetical protein n=1 Tax=Rhizobium sp. S152 TaxID=3055038 RepID=UPI0025A979B6|nr:hypothetical protein [Rhizobium sp. S152]MDM9627799.1 hypothetical protein [Rhizobium sp. S152]